MLCLDGSISATPGVCQLVASLNTSLTSVLSGVSVCSKLSGESREVQICIPVGRWSARALVEHLAHISRLVVTKCDVCFHNSHTNADSEPAGSEEVSGMFQILSEWCSISM